MPIKPENKPLYGPNWKQISHYIRFERAGGRCEECGVAHKQRRLFGSKKSLIILTTAHLDHDPTNNDEDNLKALCQRCHLRHDRKDNARRAKLTRSRKKDSKRPLFSGYTY